MIARRQIAYLTLDSRLPILDGLTVDSRYLIPPVTNGSADLESRRVAFVCRVSRWWSEIACVCCVLKFSVVVGVNSASVLMNNWSFALHSWIRAHMFKTSAGHVTVSMSYAIFMYIFSSLFSVQTFKQLLISRSVTCRLVSCVWISIRKPSILSIMPAISF